MTDIVALKRQLREARRALQIAHRAEWMVTHDWGGDRAGMWEHVRKLAGIRSWSYSKRTEFEGISGTPTTTGISEQNDER